MHCCAMQCRQRLRVIPVASKCEVNSAALDFVGSISADFDALGFGEVRRNAKGVLWVFNRLCNNMVRFNYG